MPLPIALLLVPGVSEWEFAPLVGLGHGFFGLDFVVASPDGAPIRSKGGIVMVAQAAWSDIEPASHGVLAVIGGDAWEGEDPPDVGPLARAFLDAGRVVAAICGGTAGLARAGLLDQVRHTSNGPDYLSAQAPGYRGEGHYVDQPQALRDGQIITAPAPAPASFATLVMEAAGLDPAQAGQVRSMLAAEHNG